MNFTEIIGTLLSVCNIKLLMLQLDVSSSQLLVTDSDFENANFRERLRETVESLLELRVIPVFNENDAISTRKAPYEVRCTLPWKIGTVVFV
jgi:delta-1-pyrroline-5-carboxylate synthetase